MTFSIPALETLDLSSAPLTTEWQGTSAHIGPVQAVTPLVQRLAGKTTCGTLALMSGITAWGSARLGKFTDVSLNDEMASAAFAWQYDWRLVDADKVKAIQAPEQPVEISASMMLRNFFRRSILQEQLWHSFYQPVMYLAHMAHVVRFILPDPGKVEFEGWLEAVCDRLNKVAELPEMEVPKFSDFEGKAEYRAHCAPRRGPPVPPCVLDLNINISDLDLSDESLRYLATLNSSLNRYLRTPHELDELGLTDFSYEALT